MNRNEFINELRFRLRRLPYAEIESAVNYYEEYFKGLLNNGLKKWLSNEISTAIVGTTAKKLCCNL
ncbi:MAG: hypothetical protein FWE97_03990, partial [Dehalococcoidia bacterium]|nr:hypothetical protein [Dehalococcoidia bacterium]